MENKILNNPSAFSNVRLSDSEYKWEKSYPLGIKKEILCLIFLLEALIKADYNTEEQIEQLDVLNLMCYEKDGSLEISDEDASIMFTYVKWEIEKFCRKYIQNS